MSEDTSRLPGSILLTTTTTTRITSVGRITTRPVPAAAAVEQNTAIHPHTIPLKSPPAPVLHTTSPTQALHQLRALLNQQIFVPIISDVPAFIGLSSRLCLQNHRYFLVFQFIPRVRRRLFLVFLPLVQAYFARAVDPMLSIILSVLC